MLLASWAVRIVKNSGWGLENAGRDRRPIARAAFFWLIIDRSVKRAKDCWLPLICSQKWINTMDSTDRLTRTN